MHKISMPYYKRHADVITRNATSTRPYVGPFQRLTGGLHIHQGVKIKLHRVRLWARKQARDGASPAESRRHLQAFLGSLLGSPIQFVFRSSLGRKISGS